MDAIEKQTRAAERFLEQLDETARAQVAGTDELARALTEKLEKARAAWSDVEVAPGEFATYLAERLPPAENPVQALDTLHVNDLYLACACARGAPTALNRFEKDCLVQIGPALLRLDVPPEVARDTTQRLRQQLFTTPPGEPPGICKYSGRGSLVSWLRVTATRAALRQARKENRELPLIQDRLEDIADGADDPELVYLKNLYRREFKESFAEAIGAITPRERNLLRHHLIDRLSIDEIGALYQVHRSTAARWLADARETLIRLTRKAMIGRLHLEPDEYQSIVKLIQSQIDLSIGRFLETRPPTESR